MRPAQCDRRPLIDRAPRYWGEDAHPRDAKREETDQQSDGVGKLKERNQSDDRRRSDDRELTGAKWTNHTTAHQGTEAIAAPRTIALSHSPVPSLNSLFPAAIDRRVGSG